MNDAKLKTLRAAFEKLKKQWNDPESELRDVGEAFMNDFSLDWLGDLFDEIDERRAEVVRLEARIDVLDEENRDCQEKLEDYHIGARP